MAFEQPLFSISRVAATDLSTNQYRFVKLDSNGQAVLAGAGERCMGVLQNDPLAGQVATIQVLGISKVVAGAAINPGDPVASDTNGKAKPAVSATVNTSDAGVAQDPVIGSYVIGLALEASTAADQIISVLLTHSGAVAATNA